MCTHVCCGAGSPKDGGKMFWDGGGREGTKLGGGRWARERLRPGMGVGRMAEAADKSFLPKS